MALPYSNTVPVFSIAIFKKNRKTYSIISGDYFTNRRICPKKRMISGNKYIILHYLIPIIREAGQMSGIPFSKWSPGGNTTVFLPSSALCVDDPGRLAARLQAHDMLCAEQLGFVDMAKKTLRMAGGEFCLNGSRSLGALLDLECPEKDRCYGLTVSGIGGTVLARVTGSCPDFYCEASFSLPDYPVSDLPRGLRLVRLPGICHLVIPYAGSSAPDDIKKQAGQLRREFGLDAEAACGVVWWSGGEKPAIWPLVHVRDAGTDFLENSCGSGSLAVALCLSAGKDSDFDIDQPGGESLAVRVRRQDGCWRVTVGGGVRLVARGSVWV